MIVKIYHRTEGFPDILRGDIGKHLFIIFQVFKGFAILELSNKICLPARCGVVLKIISLVYYEYLLKGIQFLIRDLDSAIKSLGNYTDLFKGKSTTDLITLLENQFRSLDLELKEKLSHHGCNNLSQIKGRSSVVQTEAANKIKNQIK